MRSREAGETRGSSHEDEEPEVVTEPARDVRDLEGLTSDEIEVHIEHVDDVLREIEDPAEWLEAFKQQGGQLPDAPLGGTGASGVGHEGGTEGNLSFICNCVR
ncbi:hypothetical protein [Streptomyces sp. NPDC048527]|uniref:hypothetical protein n=1 Tax=Streptomyces sp. NPDC048527 TaxID=3365568 RepID=UPI0037217A2D